VVWPLPMGSSAPGHLYYWMRKRSMRYPCTICSSIIGFDGAILAGINGFDSIDRWMMILLLHRSPMAGQVKNVRSERDQPVSYHAKRIAPHRKRPMKRREIGGTGVSRLPSICRVCVALADILLFIRVHSTRRKVGGRAGASIFFRNCCVPAYSQLYEPNLAKACVQCCRCSMMQF